MDINVKKFMIVFLGGGLVFLAIKRIWPVKAPVSGEPQMKVGADGGNSGKLVSTPEQKKSAITALQAYKAAVKDGQPAAKLAELNAMIFKQYGLKVYKDKSTNQYFCADANGNPI
jgi:hypothetical protein